MAKRASNKLCFLIAISFVIIGFTLGYGPTVLDSAAQQTETDAQKLSEIQKKIEREESELNDLKKKEASINAELEVVAVELNRISKDRDGLYQTVKRLENEASVVEQAILRVSKEIADARGLLEQRVVAVYKLYRRATALDYLFNAGSITDLMKRGHYLTDIASGDRARLDELRRMTKSMEDEQLRLTEVKAQRAKEFIAIDEARARIEEKHKARTKLLQDAKAEEANREKSLAKLNATAKELETVLASVMGGGTEPSEAIPPGRTTPTEEKPPIVQSTEQVLPFSGKGLGALKGKLIPPVAGPVLQRFGEKKHDEFSDFVFSKGLEFQAPVGEKVRVVAPGRVMLNRVLAGFGSVIIVDHGERFYTLYGRLASSLKQVGDTLKQGEVIAVLGEPDRKKKNFYFELRQKGKAIDPAQFFGKKLTFIQG